MTVSVPGSKNCRSDRLLHAARGAKVQPLVVGTALAEICVEIDGPAHTI